MSVIGFIAGMFDPLHAGHIEIFKIAKSQCDYLIVAVGTDEYIRKHKKHEPLLSYDDRAYAVEAIKYVDKVVATDNHDKMAMYKQYHFDVLFAGWDHLSDEEDIEAISQLEQLGVRTIFVERQRNLSSSMIKERAYALEVERRMHLVDLRLNRIVKQKGSLVPQTNTPDVVLVEDGAVTAESLTRLKGILDADVGNDKVVKIKRRGVSKKDIQNVELTHNYIVKQKKSIIPQKHDLYVFEIGQKKMAIIKQKAFIDKQSKE